MGQGAAASTSVSFRDRVGGALHMPANQGQWHAYNEAQPPSPSNPSPLTALITGQA